MKYIITIFFLFISFHSYSQKKDTILYNQFRDYVEWSKQRHKDMMEEIENEKYQMVYVDKYIVDRKAHKIYIFSSYDLYWGDESGIGWQIMIPSKKKTQRPNNNPLFNHIGPSRRYMGRY